MVNLYPREIVIELAGGTETMVGVWSDANLTAILLSIFERYGGRVIVTEAVVPPEGRTFMDGVSIHRIVIRPRT